jgi:hypothetical protein
VLISASVNVDQTWQLVSGNGNEKFVELRLPYVCNDCSILVVHIILNNIGTSLVVHYNV